MAKLSTASIRLVQKLNRMNKNFEYPVYIVVCFHGRVEKACGVSCSVKDWDSKREVVKRSNSNSVVLNKMLYDIKNRVIQRKNDFEYNGKVYTASMLLEDYRVDFNANSNVFADVMKRLVDERRLRDGSIRRYTYTYRKLSEYLRRDDYIIDELTLGVVKDFADWLEKCGIKTNTIKSLLSCIASVWNFGISKKIVNGDGYPFSSFKYTSKYKECPRDYYLERSHITRLRDYFLDLVVERHGRGWSYKEGALEKLHDRNSREFGILWFLMSYKMNGSAPIELALLKMENCKRTVIGGDDYWAIDIKRRKTSRDVHIRLKRDLFVIIGFEHFLGFSDKFVYPIINYREGCEDKYLLEQSHKTSDKAIRHVRDAYKRINEDIARDNAMNGSYEPLVDLSRLVFYTERHSFANHYLSSSGSTVNGLASLMARSPNTIATYIKQITNNEEIAAMMNCMPI